MANKIDLVSELSRIDINQSAIAAFQSKLQRSVESALKNVDLTKLDASNKQLVGVLNQLLGAFRQFPNEINRIKQATSAVTASLDPKSGRYRDSGGRFVASDIAQQGIGQKAVEVAKKINQEETKRQSLQKEVLSSLKNELSETEKLISASQRVKNNSNEFNAALQRRLTLLKQITELEGKSVGLQRLKGISGVSSNANFDPLRQQNAYLSLTQQQADKINQFSIQNAKSAARKYAQELETQLKSAKLQGNDPLSDSLQRRLDRIRGIQSALQDPTRRFSERQLGNITDFSRGGRSSLIDQKINNSVLQEAAVQTDRVARAAEKASINAQKFGDQIGLAVKRYGAFLVGTAGFFTVINAFRTGTEEALKFEKAQTRLSQILAVPRNDVSAITGAARQQSLSTGTSTTEILQGVDILAQAGFQKVDQLTFAAEKLSKVPLTATFDGIDKTADGLIAVLRQFNFELNDTGEIFDKVNRVAADYAVEVKDIFDGVKRGGAVFVEAGGDFDDFLKYFTLLRDRSRESSETIGSFFKSIGFRLFRPENEQILKNLGVSGNTIQDRLSGTAGAFERRFGDNLNGNPEAIRLAQQLAGVYQGGRFLNLLSAITADRGKFDRSIGQSQGSFESEASKRIEDIGSSFKRLQEAINSFIAEFTSNNSLRSLFKFLADSAEQISKFGSALAPVITVLAGVGAVAAVPVLGRVGLSAANRLGFVTRGSAEREAKQLLPDQFINGQLDQDRILSRQRLEQGIYNDSFLGRRTARSLEAQNRGFGRFRSSLFTNTGLGGGLPSLRGVARGVGFGASVGGIFATQALDAFRQNEGDGDFAQQRNAILRNQKIGNTQGVLGSAFTGATVGTAIGGPVGTAAGLVIGLAGSVLTLSKNSQEAKEKLENLNQAEAKRFRKQDLDTVQDPLRNLRAVSSFRNRLVDPESPTGVRIRPNNVGNVLNQTLLTLQSGDNRKLLEKFVEDQTSRGVSPDRIRERISDAFQVGGIKSAAVKDQNNLKKNGELVREIVKIINDIVNDFSKIDNKGNIKKIQSTFIDLVQFFNTAVTGLASELSLNTSKLTQRNELITSRIPSARGEFGNAEFNLSGRNLLNAVSSNSSLLGGTGINTGVIQVYKQIANGIDSNISELDSILSNPANRERAGKAARDFITNSSENRNPINAFDQTGIARIGQIFSELSVKTGISSEELIQSFNKAGTKGVSDTANQILAGPLGEIENSIRSVIDSFNKIENASNQFNQKLIDSSNKVFEFSNQINNIKTTGGLSSISNLTAIGSLNSGQSLRQTLGVLDQSFRANNVSTSAADFSNRINANNAIINRTGSNLSIQNTSLADQERINKAIRDNAVIYNDINKALQSYTNQLDVLSQGTSLLIQSYQQQRSELTAFGKENFSFASNNGGRNNLRLDLLSQFGRSSGLADAGSVRLLSQRQFDRGLEQFTPQQQEKLLETLQRLPDVPNSPLSGIRGKVEEFFLDRGARDLSKQIGAATQQDPSQIFDAIKKGLEKQRDEIINRTKQEDELRAKQIQLVTIQLDAAKKDQTEAAKFLENSEAMLKSVQIFSDNGSKALESVKVAADKLNKFVSGFSGNEGIKTEITVSPIQVDLKIINGSIFKELIRQNNNNIADAIATAIEKATGTRPNNEAIPEPGTE